MELQAILESLENLEKRVTRAHLATLVPLDFPVIEESKVTKGNAESQGIKETKEKWEMRASRGTWVKREIEEYLALPALRAKKAPKAQKEVKDLEEKLAHLAQLEKKEPSDNLVSPDTLEVPAKRETKEPKEVTVRLVPKENVEETELPVNGEWSDLEVSGGKEAEAGGWVSLDLKEILANQVPQDQSACPVWTGRKVNAASRANLVLWECLERMVFPDHLGSEVLPVKADHLVRPVNLE